MADCQRWVSSKEFSEWLAYQRLEPFPAELLDIHLSSLRAEHANANRDSKKRRQPFRVEDFRLFDSQAVRPKQAQTPREIYAVFRSMAINMGAKPK